MQLEANRDIVRVNRIPGGGGTPLHGLKGYVPLNKSVFKDSRESQKSTISLFSVSFFFFFNAESVFLT